MKGVFMIYVGIDVAKNKHDCFIVDSNGEVIKEVFTIKNSHDGFNKLFDAIPDVDPSELIIGLEATGHYGFNLIDFITQNQLPLTVLNPLSVNLFRKSITLRKTKTDKIDAKVIALFLRAGDYRPYVPVSYHLTELKSLTRHRYRLVGERAKFKVSITRLVDILFPELNEFVWSIHQKSAYELLKAFPSAPLIASANLTRLTNILKKASRGKYSRDKAILIRDAAKKSIGSNRAALIYELLQTIDLITVMNHEINKLNTIIKDLMIDINSVIISIPGISYNLGSMILAEIGDISRFTSPSQLLAFAGLEPGTHQSGNFTATNMKMVKRGSKYLRWSILQAARLITMRDPVFSEYYAKKKAEGKHHNVVISHVSRKLIRVIFHILTMNMVFESQSK